MEKKLIFENYLKIHSIKDVNKSGTKIQREVMSRTLSDKDYSVAGTLYDVKKDIFYFVSQYRAGAEEKDRYLTEVVAGTVEDNEDPKDCFIREAMEEVGFEVEDIRESGHYYTSPGATSEKIFLFHAIGSRVNDGGGLESENEDIEVLEYSMEEVVAKMTNNEFQDIKTQLLILEIIVSVMD